MRQTGEKGLTLVELVISIAILGILATAAIYLLSSSLDAQNHGSAKTQLYQEGLMAMERMTTGVRKSSFLLIPNAHNPTRDILAFSGRINDDDDHYFDDSIFPRIDEDLNFDMNEDGKNGIASIDDDGDGMVDEGVISGTDDDEDGLVDEDWIDGIDNDGDGNIDEDCGRDSNNDGASGIIGMDDEAHGDVDDNRFYDDDEDGTTAEAGLIPVIYSFDNNTNTLTESIPYTGESDDLSDHVTKFEVKYQSPGLIQINLELTSDDNESVQFSEYAYARNTYQKKGKKVR